LSNAGSLLGLISYPLVVDPLLNRSTQAWVWSLGFGLTALLLASGGRFKSSAAAAAPPPPTPPIASTAIASRLTWVVCSTLGSGLLVATTAALTHDIAGVPLLWVAPLAVYLITFIVAFDHSRWYHRPTFAAALVVAALVTLDGVNAVGEATLGRFGTTYLFGLFVAAQVCHGELYRARPNAEQLTSYYLHIAAGGALGSFAVALIAPVVFDQLLELPLLWLLVVSGFCYQVWRQRQRALVPWLGLGLLLAPLAGLLLRSIDSRRSGDSRWTVVGEEINQGLSAITWIHGGWIGLAVTALLLTLRPTVDRRGTHAFTGFLLILPLGLACAWAEYGILRDPHSILSIRNYHGLITVSDYHPELPRSHIRYLSHGVTTHGTQLMHPDYQTWPTTYYSPESGLGLAFTAVADSPAPRRVGIIGLGVGTVASYGQTGDLFRFYELDSDIAHLAQTEFTALSQSRATIEIQIGDGRLLLATEATQPQPPLFDLLVIDAFSSDAVPIHLLTQEAFALYESRLTPAGLLVVNVSNRLVDLRNVVLAQAHASGLAAAVIYHQPLPADWWAFASEWILLARTPARLHSPAITAAADPAVGVPLQPYLARWTDEHASLWSALR
jgi:spermidine synthase